MISTRSPQVAVEYTSRGQRVTKVFSDAYAARRFFVSKLQAGADPKVKKVE